ncbi:MAG: Ppx/GppA family phosphatase [Actinomycetota bacterium]|nr:Ppx/GppA family phosphatase [Actinomycetota bacterium]
MRVAAVDIGTNSARLLVAEPGPGGGLAWLDRRVRVVRLGEGVDATARLSQAAMDRALRVLATYRRAVSDWDVQQARAVGTSAVRDASNRDEFLDRAQGVLGFRPEAITADEEAALSFGGAVIGLSELPAPFLVIDVGGGSTELVFGDRRPSQSTSVDIGSVRLTERSLPDRPATGEQLEAARHEVARLLAGLRFPSRPATVAGVAGTFTSLAAIDLQLDSYDPGLVHGAGLSLGDLRRLIEYLAHQTLEETQAIPSLDPARAPVLLAGAVVAEATVRCTGADRVVVSESDLLDGVAMGLVRNLGYKGATGEQRSGGWTPPS